MALASRNVWRGRYAGAIVLTLALCGCTPYLFAGVGYAGESGEYYFDERGVTGTVGVGVELGRNVRCEFRHRSMVNAKPEVIINDVGCDAVVYFRGRK